MMEKLVLVPIYLTSNEKKNLEKVAEKKGMDLSAMGRRAIRAYLFALRGQRLFSNS